MAETPENLAPRPDAPAMAPSLYEPPQILWEEQFAPLTMCTDFSDPHCPIRGDDGPPSRW